jgi:tetratricopeptide (TPR) repeat protein
MPYILRIHALTCIKRLLIAVVLPNLASFYVNGRDLNAQPRSQQCDASAVFERAGQLIGNRQYDQALIVLNAFRDCPARSSVETFQLGWLYGRARRFADALAVFETVPPAVPDPLTHDYAIALSRFELAQYQKAIDILKPEQLSGKADEKAVNLLAVSYSKLGLYRDAYDVLSAQTRRDPTDLTTYLNLVTVCAEGGDLRKAAEVASQAKQLFPNSPDVLIVLGAAETMLGHLDQAFEDFSASAKLAPARGDARFFLALVDYKQGKFSDAVAVLQKAVNDGIADSDLHYLMAECLLKIDPAREGEALQQLNRAVDLNTGSVSARTLRGKLLLETGNPKEAITDLEIARQQDPGSRATLYNLARAYQAIGRTREAQAIFKQFRSQNANTLSEFSDTRLNDTLTGRAGQQP